MSIDTFNKNPELARILGERKSQTSPKDFPETRPDDYPPHLYPLPWRIGAERGNGHMDVLAANGGYVAHVYCWDGGDIELLQKKLEKINAAKPQL